MKKNVVLAGWMMAAALMAGNAWAEEAATEAEVTEAAVLENWALKFAFGSEDFGVDAIYYTKAYFAQEGLTNPATAEAYTEEEITAISDAAVAGAENYIAILPADAVIGMGVYGTDAIYWYDAENAAAIVSSADPLVLDAESGEMANLEGEKAVSAMQALSDWAYGAITLGSEAFNVGTVYYAEGYFQQEGIINPVSVVPYTAEELAQIKAAAVMGNDAYQTGIPEGAVIGMSTCDGAELVWFDAEGAAALTASADPLVLDSQEKQLTTLDGEVVAAGMDF